MSPLPPMAAPPRIRPSSLTRAVRHFAAPLVRMRKNCATVLFGFEPSALETAVFWTAFFAKLTAGAALPLTDDEAYYWVWAHHLQLSYYDHPAIIAVIYWLGKSMTWFPGSVRWPGICLGQLTLAIWLRILRPYFDAPQRLCFLGLAVLSPMILGRGGVLVMPDLPLMFFYVVSLWLFLQWRDHPDPLRAYALGLSMGLGFSSKYMMVLFPISLLPLVFFAKDMRRPLVRCLPWLFAGGVLGSLPVWLWNALNNFVSFKFQLNSRFEGAGLNLRSLSRYVGGEILLIFPPVLYWAARARRLPLVFHLVAWMPLLFFFGVSLFVIVEIKWPSEAYLPLFALAASHYPRNRNSMIATFAVWAVALIVIGVAILTRPSWVSPKYLKDICDCDRLAAAVVHYQPIYAGSYQIAAKLQFETGRPIYKLRGMTRTDFYDFLPQSEPVTKKFYVAAKKGDRLPADFVARGDRIVRVIPVDHQFEIWKVEAP